LEPIVDGAQPIDVSVGAGPGTCNVTVAVGLWLPRVAVTVAVGVVEDVNVPAVAEKVALLCPDSTVTLEGTLRAALLLCTETCVLDVAVLFRETVHVEEALEPIVEGVQPTDVSVGAALGTWSVTLAVGLWLPRVAVTVALGVVEDVNVPVVAEALAVLFPDKTVTPEGMLSAALLLPRETTVFARAGWFRVTVQAVEEVEGMEAGAQETAVNTSGGSSVSAVLTPPAVAVAP
jgi:hypothetical protein